MEKYRKKEVIKFVIEHKDVLDKALRASSNGYDHKTREAKKAIEVARKELNYSPKTVNQDIYSTILRYYKCHITK